MTKHKACKNSVLKVKAENLYAIPIDRNMISTLQKNVEKYIEELVHDKVRR